MLPAIKTKTTFLIVCTKASLLALTIFSKIGSVFIIVEILIGKMKYSFLRAVLVVCAFTGAAFVRAGKRKCEGEENFAEKQPKIVCGESCYIFKLNDGRAELRSSFCRRFEKIEGYAKGAEREDVGEITMASEYGIRDMVALMSYIEGKEQRSSGKQRKAYWQRGVEVAGDLDMVAVARLASHLRFDQLGDVYEDLLDWAKKSQENEERLVDELEPSILAEGFRENVARVVDRVYHSDWLTFFDTTDEHYVELWAEVYPVEESLQQGILDAPKEVLRGFTEKTKEHILQVSEYKDPTFLFLPNDLKRYGEKEGQERPPEHVDHLMIKDDALAEEAPGWVEKLTFSNLTTEKTIPRFLWENRTQSLKLERAVLMTWLSQNYMPEDVWEMEWDLDFEVKRVVVLCGFTFSPERLDISKVRLIAVSACEGLEFDCEDYPNLKRIMVVR